MNTNIELNSELRSQIASMIKISGNAQIALQASLDNARTNWRYCLARLRTVSQAKSTKLNDVADASWSYGTLLSLDRVLNETANWIVACMDIIENSLPPTLNATGARSDTNALSHLAQQTVNFVLDVVAALHQDLSHLRSHEPPQIGKLALAIAGSVPTSTATQNPATGQSEYIELKERKAE